MKVTKSMLVLLGLCAVMGCEKDNIRQYGGTAGDDGEDTTERTIEVVYSSTGDATVSGQGGSQTVSIDGNGVTIVNTGTEKIDYHLSGVTSNGYLKIYSVRKQTLTLNSVQITNPAGAAINIQGPKASPSSGKKANIVVNGTNALADGSTYSSTPTDEDEKATLFSEGQLIFSGEGSLTVTAIGKAGITSDDYVMVTDNVSLSISSSAGHGLRGKDSVLLKGGTVNINVSASGKKGISTDGDCHVSGGVTTVVTTGSAVVSDGDTSKVAGIKADGDFAISGGTLTVTCSGTGAKGISADGTGVFDGGVVRVSVTGSNMGGGSSGRPGPWGGQESKNGVSAKGIKCEGDITINGGTVSVTATAHEAIESKGKITINGGEVYGYSQSDDGINSAGDMVINNGYVCGSSAGNDGLDANGDLDVKGGVVYAICTASNGAEMALDADERHKLTIHKGCTLIAVGSLERGATLSQTCYRAQSYSKTTWYSMTVGGSTYVFKTPSGGKMLVVSGTQEPTLTSGVTVSGGTDFFGGLLKTGSSVSGGSQVTLSGYTSSNY